MKKIIYILSITFLVLQSCSSGSLDNNNSNENDLLYRKWYFVSRTYNNNTTTYHPCNNGHRDYVEFSSPNSANFYYVASSSGNECSDDYALEPFTFTKNGNTLKMSYGGIINYSTISISELSVTDLKYVETDSDGFSVYYVYKSY